MNRAALFNVFVTWIPFAALATMLCFLVYLVDQQNLRTNGNDPQIQIAQDVAHAIDTGADATKMFGGSHTDISVSLAPYVVVYSNDTTPLSGTGFLNGVLPQVPSGVLATARARGEDRVTWQPAAGVREAIVAIPLKSGGSVVAGRSLKEIESRVDQMGKIVILGWLVTLAVLFLKIAAITYYFARVRGR